VSFSNSYKWVVLAVLEGGHLADDVSRRPPRAHVLMYTAVAYQHVAEATHVGQVVAEQHVQLVHPLQVERDAALAAVDLECVVVGSSVCEARDLECADRSALKTGQEQRRVVHSYLTHLLAR